MPKIIADIQPTLLQTARKMLFSRGYAALTIRSLASACGIAVGTVYNYFPTKDVLVAHVILADWQQSLQRMEQQSHTADQPLQAMQAILEEISAFWRSYTPLWQEYAAKGSASTLRSPYHPMLISQLADIIRPVLAHFGCLYAPALPAFLAEALLSAAAGGADCYHDIEPILKRILTA